MCIPIRTTTPDKENNAVFCLLLEVSCLQFSFLLTVVFRVFYLQLEFFTYNWSFFLLTVEAFLLKNGTVLLINTSMDGKQKTQL